MVCRLFLTVSRYSEIMNRIKQLQQFIKAWENFTIDIPEEFDDEVWRRMRTLVELSRTELNAQESLEKRKT